MELIEKWKLWGFGVEKNSWVAPKEEGWKSGCDRALLPSQDLLLLLSRILIKMHQTLQATKNQLYQIITALIISTTNRQLHNKL